MTDRTQRLEMKLTGEEKRVLDLAASLLGAESLGGWVRTLALREARKVLRENGAK